LLSAFPQGNASFLRYYSPKATFLSGVTLPRGGASNPREPT
jgi:hypothetical protein